MRTIYHAFILNFVLLAACTADLRAEEKTLAGKVTSLTIEQHDENELLSQQKTDLRIKISTDGVIVGVQENGTKLIGFSDNLGTNLLEQGIRWRKQQKYVTSAVENAISCGKHSGVRIHDKAINFSVNVTAIPAPGATTITVKGQLALRFSPPDGTKTQQSEALPLPKCRGQAKFGDNTIELESSGWASKNGVNFDLMRVRSSVIVTKISLLDQAGKELIKSTTPEKLELEQSVIDNVAKVQFEYLLPVVRIIPFEVTTGVGL